MSTESTPMSVLVIEDNPTQANLLRIGLTRRGFKVECVAYLNQAIERVKKGDLDVILMDLNLPDSEGLNTFYDMFTHAAQIPIVVLTALNDQEKAMEAMNAGAHDYLIKGVPSDESVVRCLRYAVQRQKFETQLWETERRTRLILENAYDAFLAMSDRCIITEWNKRAETEFGWYRNEAVGKYFPDLLLPKEERENFVQSIANFINGERDTIINNRVEINLLHKSGHEFAAEIAVFPVSLARSYNFCAFVHDISGRPRVGESAFLLNKNLEKRVEQQSKALQKSSYHLQQLTRYAEHELRGPIESLHGYTNELLRNHRDKLPAEVQELIDKIDIEVERLSGGVDQLTPPVVAEGVAASADSS